MLMMTEDLKSMVEGNASVMDIESVSNSIYKIGCAVEDLSKMEEKKETSKML
jgi:hypothetical protein